MRRVNRNVWLLIHEHGSNEIGSVVALEPMWNCTKARVCKALRRPAPELISTNWYDPAVTRRQK